MSINKTKPGLEQRRTIVCNYKAREQKAKRDFVWKYLSYMDQTRTNDGVSATCNSTVIVCVCGFISLETCLGRMTALNKHKLPLRMCSAPLL